MAILDYIGGNPGNYALGRGKIYLGGEVNGHPLGWRDIGNCTAFTLTQESEKKEHLSYLSGVKTVDLEVAVSTKVTCSFTIDEVGNMLNLAPFLSGTATGYEVHPNYLANLNAAAVASDSVNDAAWNAAFGGSNKGPVLLGSENVWLPLSPGHLSGMWYDLEIAFAQGLGTHRVTNLDSTQTVLVRRGGANRADTAGGTLLTEGIDYELDRKMGRIRFTVGSFTANVMIKWSAPAVNRHPAIVGLPGQDTGLAVVKPLTNSGLTLGLKFIGENPTNGLFTEHEYFKVKLSPDGDLALIGDDWGAMSFTGVLSTVPTYPANASPYGRITSRSSFVP